MVVVLAPVKETRRHSTFVPMSRRALLCTHVLHDVSMLAKIKITSIIMCWNLGKLLDMNARARFGDTSEVKREMLLCVFSTNESLHVVREILPSPAHILYRNIAPLAPPNVGPSEFVLGYDIEQEQAEL